MTPEQLNACCRRDFMTFAMRTFYYLNPAVEFLPNWHLQVIADALTHCWRGNLRRLLICVPPRSLKSLMCSVALPAWILGHEPTAKLLCASYGAELAEELSRQCRLVLDSDWYRTVFPNTRLSGKRNSVTEFQTTRGGTRIATSVGGQLTGRGADFIIIDDPLKPDEALSDTQRQAVNEWWDHTLITRLNRKDVGRILLIMQRLHLDDLAGHVVELEPWHAVVLPALAEADETHGYTQFGRKFIHRRRARDALHPARESAETLAMLRRTLGEAQFSAQYQQSPVPLGGALVKTAWLRYYAPHELAEPPDWVFQSWDTANKDTELSDYSACTTWGVKDKHLYLLDVTRARLTYPDLKRQVQLLAQRYRPRTVLIEDKASGTQLIQELQQAGLYTVTGWKPDTSKLMRMHAQTAMIENGFVLLPTEAVWLAEFVRELTTFPQSKHDDQVDSLSQALNWFKVYADEPAIIEYYRRLVDEKRRASGG